MMGDSSDNIPGITGVGEKTAKSFIEKYGSLENLYAHVGDLSGKIKERVEESKETAFMSKSLATIDTSVDIPLTIEDMKYSFPFDDAVRKLFIDLDFRNIIKREELFVKGVSVNVGEKDELPEKVVISSYKDLFNVDEGKTYSVCLGDNLNLYDGEKEYEVKINADLINSGVEYDAALKFLGRLTDNKAAKLITYGKKELMTLLYKNGISFTAFADDVCIEKYLADFSGREEKLEEVIEFYGLRKDYPAYSLFKIHEELHGKLVDEGMLDLYEKMELPLCDVLFDMERAGFKVDINALTEMEKEYDSRINVLLEKITELAGEKINPNSTKQLAVVLYEKLGLKSGKKTKNGYSTNAETLEKLTDEHPIIPLILKYRQLQKLNSTYVKGFLPLIDGKTGLIHTCFNQTLTTTGRLSSKEPNLQNIPVREQEGKEIRKLFISSFDGGKIVGADYSQIELRLLAHFSDCAPLIDTFLNGGDIHALTASQVFGVELNAVTPEMRRSAKAVNFGIIYGISDYGLSEQLKISPKQASDYIKKYFKTYPNVKSYMDSNVTFAREHGYVETLFKRKRYIPEINSPNYNLRSFGERAAMNMPLQGTAADIIKIAMIAVERRIKEENLKSKLILQVHDELLVDTCADEVEKVENILKEEMQSAVKLKVPLTVEIECGTRWFDAK